MLSTILISASSFVLFHIHKRTKNNQQAVLSNLNYFHHQFLKDQTQVAGFLANETTNDHFFITGESDFLATHHRHSANIDSCYMHCQQIQSNASHPPVMLDLRKTYTNYCMAFDSLVYKIYQRGYKNYGLEGELASYLYKLEKFNSLPIRDVTSLKLAEKTYINNQDTSYISYVHKHCNGLIVSVLNNNNYSPQQKTEIIGIIKSYKNTFRDLVDIDNKIGSGKQEGLKSQLSEISYQLEDLVNSSILEAENTYKANMSTVNTLFGLTVFLLIAFAFALSVYTSKFLVRNLEQLTLYIQSLTKTNFNQRIEFDIRHSTTEIRQIYLAFRNMLADLRVREQQRDRALRIAEDNQQRYQELADLLPQCIYETDRMGNLTYANKAWHNTFGYSDGEVENGINLIEILNAAPNSSLFGYTKVENNDFIASRKDGTKFPATVYSDVIKKGVRVVGRRGIIIDSSLRNKYIESLKKETARAITSDKHKSSFLANMSHEIRTPMNSIIGFTNMLASQEIPDEMKGNFIDHIQTSSEMLLNLIDDIIDIAKIEDGQLKIKKSECNPVELIESLAANFEAYKNRAEKEHLKIVVNVPSEGIALSTDKFRLKQILTNLMSNAIKFTEAGRVEVGMKVKNQRTLEFYVEDTGMGMTKEDLRTVFERFKRTKLTEEKKITGTGLGLAISKNLVEMLGGNMWVTSEPNKGTRFTFELPYVRVAQIAPKPTRQPKETDKINWSNKKFLIAEDDDYGYTYMTHILEKTGVETIRAKNGKEALEALKFHDDISLVLMDLRMPVMNGLETTQKLKEQFPLLPVIAQTAFAMEGDRNKCLEAGCDDYITKPINAENLLAKIGQFIETNTPAGSTPAPSENNANIPSSVDNISQKNNNDLA